MFCLFCALGSLVVALHTRLMLLYAFDRFAGFALLRFSCCSVTLALACPDCSLCALAAKFLTRSVCHALSLCLRSRSLCACCARMLLYCSFARKFSFITYIRCVAVALCTCSLKLLPRLPCLSLALRLHSLHLLALSLSLALSNACSVQLALLAGKFHSESLLALLCAVC